MAGTPCPNSQACIDTPITPSNDVQTFETSQNTPKRNIFKVEWNDLTEDELLERMVQINKVRMMQLELTEEVDENGDIFQPWDDQNDVETLWEAVKLLKCFDPPMAVEKGQTFQSAQEKSLWLHHN